MRVRSTGLGKQQMKAGIADIMLADKNTLMMKMETTEPVQWKIRISMGHDDLMKLIGYVLKPKNFFGVVKLILFTKGECDPQGEW